MKKVFIDCGANKGQSVDWLRAKYDPYEEFEVHCFEPTPNYQKYFGKKINFHNTAVWIKDCFVDFYVRSSLGSTLMSEKTSGGPVREVIKTKAIDLSKWITDNFDKEDYIILKIDIEGAEFEVVDKLLNDGVIDDYIDIISVEFHVGKIPQYKDVHAKALIERIKKTNAYLTNWEKF